jgi:hypothetical protein
VAVFVGFFVFGYFNYQPPKNLDSFHSEITIDVGDNNESRLPITDPVFETVYLADVYLQDDSDGLVLFDKNKARFYPFQILVWHNLVEDVWNGENIVIEYEPLCGKAYPGLVMSWQSFKKNFPNGSVLSRDTGYSRDYSRNPYGDYADTPAVWFPVEDYDPTYPAKTIIFGYGDEIFPLDNIKSAGTILGTKVDFVWDEDFETVRGFDKEGKEVWLERKFWFCKLSEP